MNKREQYRLALRELGEWDEYLFNESGLPGPRGNLELAQAVADEGHRELFLRYAATDAEQAPVNTPGEFLAFCGVVGLGACLARGERDLLPILRERANDPRWRTREAVAMALQRWGARDMDALLKAMTDWAQGSPLEQRAAAAGLCEPSLLGRAEHAVATLEILDTITRSLAQATDRRNEAFQALRKGLGYCWSVVVAAHPDVGIPYLERWLEHDDKDVRWVIKQNLTKKRLARAAPDWNTEALARWQRGPVTEHQLDD